MLTKLEEIKGEMRVARNQTYMTTIKIDIISFSKNVIG